MSQYYENMIEAKEQDVNIQPSEKCNHWKSIALKNLFIAHDNIPIRHMARKMAMEKLKSNQIEHFQVGYMSYKGSNQNKMVKYQV